MQLPFQNNGRTTESDVLQRPVGKDQRFGARVANLREGKSGAHGSWSPVTPASMNDVIRTLNTPKTLQRRCEASDRNLLDTGSQDPDPQRNCTFSRHLLEIPVPSTTQEAPSSSHSADVWGCSKDQWSKWMQWAQVTRGSGDHSRSFKLSLV